MTSTQFPVVTICGSMRYYSTMIEVAQFLTSTGHIVLMPFVADYTGDVEVDGRKAMLDDMHFTKISMSETIYVIGEHRGKSTTKEIEYAQVHGVEVRYW